MIRPVSLVAMVVAAFVQGATAQSAAPIIEPPVRTFGQFRAEVRQAVPVLGGRRVYYVTAADELWLYDVAVKKTTRIAVGKMSALAVSPIGDRVVFTRADEGTRTRYIWTLPLDPMSGLAAGPAQRASVSPGASPSISPDGKWIVFAADSGQQRLAVIPSNGGAERTVLQRKAGIGGPVWSADGRAIYFTAWTKGADSIQRIPAAGGKPEILGMTDDGPYISPDGAHIAFSFGNDDVVYSIADANGRIIGNIKDASYRWLSPTELFHSRSVQPNALMALSLADGVSRVILPATRNIEDVAWAPDGRTFAALSWVDDTARVLLSDASGTHVRTVMQRSWGPYSMVWSPDGKSIAMANEDSLLFYDVARGTQRAVGMPNKDGYAYSLHWTADSRSLRYVFEVDKDDDHPDLEWYQEVRAAGVDGSDVRVRRFEPWLSEGEAAFVSDTSVVVSVRDSSAAYTYSLATGRMTRIFAAKTLRPSVASGGSLLVMRTPDAAGVRVANVVTATGARVADVVFPGIVGGGVLRDFIVTPDQKNLIASGRDASGNCCALYEVPLGSGPARLLATVTHVSAPYLALSPDGKTLLYTAGAGFTTTFQAYDISCILHPPHKP